MTVVEPLEFERLVVTRNPESTNARNGQRLLGLLNEAFPGRLHEIGTFQEHRANIEHVAEYLRDGDIVAPFGGDTTVAQAAGRSPCATTSGGSRSPRSRSVMPTR